VKGLKPLIVVLAMAVLVPMTVQAAEEAAPKAEDPASSASDQTAEAPAKCLQAVVNPVTGFAICVNPKGAPVEPPPTEAYQRPCKPRAHDDDDWTVYEHASGCGD